MMNIMKKKLYRQLTLFLLISGIGWVIDIVSFLTILHITHSSPIIVNFMSSTIAITYVFVVSTRKVFINRNRTLAVIKFFWYIIYQVIMICLASIGIQMFVDLFNKFKISSNIFISLEILGKIFVTPITMLCNFVFMKILIEFKKKDIGDKTET